MLGGGTHLDYYYAHFMRNGIILQKKLTNGLQFLLKAKQTAEIPGKLPQENFKYSIQAVISEVSSLRSNSHKLSAPKVCAKENRHHPFLGKKYRVRILAHGNG